VPYDLFKLFLVYKISTYKYIYENGKKKWEKKKKRKFLLVGPGGGVFGPAERECARGRGIRPSRPTKERRGAGRRHGRGPTRQREEGLTAWSGRRRGGGEPVGSTAGDARDGSPPGSQFRDGEVVARHGWW
jgi:hypothetical protein